ncbi:MAG: DUF3769 domain-containing protein [Cyanobacteria bacterium RI_101]|nr:DUF3769 domain-containing protein [Cyanobacteria bacterium RI_101]
MPFLPPFVPPAPPVEFVSPQARQGDLTGETRGTFSAVGASKSDLSLQSRRRSPLTFPYLRTLDNLGKQTAKRLLTQARDSEETQEFLISPPGTPAQDAAPDNGETPAPEVVELISDRQEYDADRQVVTATGNVTMRFANGVLLADRLEVNLPDRFAVAEGNVTLKRGQQTLQGQRFEYFFVLNKGVIYQAQGEIYQPTTARDLSPTLPTDPAGNLISGQTLNERLSGNQPAQNITANEGLGLSVGAGFNLNQFGTAGVQTPRGGKLNRLRFQAERVDFDAEGWNAQKVRITNDPFNPPELEVQAETADYYNVAPQVDEVRLSGSRVLLDQTNSLPFQDRLTIDRRDRQPGVLSFGYDGEDRGGLYIQSGFTPIDTNSVRFQIKPQYLIQKAFFPNAFPEANQSNSEVCALCPSVFGLITDLDANFSERTRLINTLNFSNLNLDELEDSLRAKLSLQNKLGDLNNPYDLRVEYNYRERLFNGSLGFQTVNSSVGAVLVSPTLFVGADPSLTFSYQASIQDVQADTDQADLLAPNQDDNLVTLMRYQGAASLNKYFFLWIGESLPATPDQGLRYSPTPIIPYLQLSTGLTGVASLYSDGTSQPSLTGSVGLLGQFGHFSKPYLDYTGFNLSYFQGIRGDASPFLFDRFADTQVLSWGVTQQVYGPLRVGIQSAYSINANKEISTDYFIEYSRRTYNLQIRYNPQLQVGSVNLRISDFNWSGNPGAFEGTDIRPVFQGVTR